MEEYYTIRWLGGSVEMLDQRYLPQEVIYRNYTDYIQVAGAIRDMVIRGAPAIGASAAYGLALSAVYSSATTVDQFLSELDFAADLLKSARPTAVNLAWAIGRIMKVVRTNWQASIELIRELIIAEALKIADSDIQTNKLMAVNGLSIIPEKANIIHHCNTGALATVGYGTALGVIRAAHERGKQIHVYVDETRPRLQGARLTSWELKQLGVPHTVIVDGAAAHIMRTVGIDLCLVGCDRIAANGDVANKIGTYHLSLAAMAHNVPFYCVGPTTTIDINTPSGDQIPIEERSASEVTHIGDCHITPKDVNVANPAFDITPARFIRGIITERGIVEPPYLQNIAKIMAL